MKALFVIYFLLIYMLLFYVVDNKKGTASNTDSLDKM